MLDWTLATSIRQVYLNGWLVGDPGKRGDVQAVLGDLGLAIPELSVWTPEHGSRASPARFWWFLLAPPGLLSIWLCVSRPNRPAAVRACTRMCLRDLCGGRRRSRGGFVVFVRKIFGSRLTVAIQNSGYLNFFPGGGHSFPASSRLLNKMALNPEHSI